MEGRVNLKCPRLLQKMIALVKIEIFNIFTLTNPQVQAHLYKLEKNGYKRFFQFPKIDICQLVSKANRQNVLVKSILNIMRQFFENFKACPFVGNMTLTNLSLNEKVLFMFPQGTFRYTCIGSSEIDDLIYYVSILFQIEE